MTIRYGLAAATAALMILTACGEKAEGPPASFDQETPNALGNAATEIEAVPQDGLVAPEDAPIEQESQGTTGFVNQTN